MKSEEYFNILSNVKDFPSIPDTVVRLKEALDNPDSGIDDIVSIVGQDPALTARLIKVSNSSYFGYREKITTIHKAVSILGFNIIKQLTVITSVVSSFVGSHRNFDRIDFWKHSVGVGTCCKIMGRKYGMSINTTDELFTIGLLHDLGKLITEKYFPKEFNEILDVLNREDIYFWEAEKKILGLTHGEIGRWVSKLWGFDQIFIDLISYHHSVNVGMEEMDDEDKKSLAILNVADTIVKDKGIGSGGDIKKAALQKETAILLKLDKDTVSEIIRELDRSMEKIDDFVTSIS